MIEYDSNNLKSRDIHQDYLDFLDDENKDGTYHQLVKEMTQKQRTRLIVNINELRRRNPTRARCLLNNSFEELMHFEKALKDYASSIDNDFLRKVPDVFIGLEGSFGAKHVTPRTLTSQHLGQIVCIEGIVTKCSLVRPKVIKSVHFCPATKKVMERRYTDLTSYEAFPSSTVYPTKDEDGNLLETEFGLSIYKDHQTFTIQEMPEKAPPGQLPRSIDIIADNDLVDSCKPGDRVQVVGTHRCLPSKQGSYTSGTFRTVLLANNIVLQSKEIAPLLFDEDALMCKKFSKRKNVFDELARSLAPSIHGHEFIKKALLCMLLGGVEKILPNGSRIRGDINILLVGDPSVAKSQMLRYVLHTAPRAIATTGRGSSGVGLTAAVTSDFETGERRLEAGAMVLADRGVVCIDEFDKMSDIDRTAIHEVMEQGRVTITKAGINAKLNARCSVLAAANPVYGRYDEYKTPMENIGLQDSLLSRFDLLFILLDKHDRELDRKISDHVSRMHRYRAPHEEDGEPLPIVSSADFLSTRNIENDADENHETQIYEKYDKLLYANRSRKEKIISVNFMKKYIHLAKQMKPTLTQEACDKISESYANLRGYDQEHTDYAKTQPVTARSLETMIRLSTAHAKARLSPKVEEIDAEAAIELVQFAIFKRVIEKPRKKRRRVSGAEISDEETSGVEVLPDAKRRGTTTPGPYDFTDDEGPSESKKKSHVRSSTGEGQVAGDAEMSTEQQGDVPMEEVEVNVSEDRLRQFKKLLMAEFKKGASQSIEQAQVKNALMSGDGKFSELEINKCLDKLHADNAIFISESVIYLV